MADSWLKFKPEFAGSIVEPSENPLSGQWQTETLPFRLEKRLLSSFLSSLETTHQALTLLTKLHINLVEPQWPVEIVLRQIQSCYWNGINKKKETIR